MKYLIFNLVALTFLFSACEQTIKLDLPTHKSELVVEFYIEDGQPLRCVLQESISFTAPVTNPLVSNPLVSNALVVVSHNGVRDTLRNIIQIDTLTRKVYNYTLPKIITAQPNAEYELFIRDTRGRTITGKTRFIAPTPIEKHDYVFNTKDSASVGIFFNDPVGKNFYRAMAYKQARRIEINERADAELPDNTFDGQLFGFYTDYVFAKNDTVAMRLYSLLPDHYDYNESIEDAFRANVNPFAQPANIRSNVQGGLGIFTTLNYIEKKDIILK
jgi:hypothetical protein